MLCDPEVGDEGAALGVEEDVLGLHVAVDDPELVGASERVPEHLPELDRLGDRGGPRFSRSRSVPPVDERHDEEGPVRRAPDLEQRDETLGLAERREQPLLALEALRPLRLHRRRTLSATSRPSRSPAAEDDAHPSAPELGDDRVGTDLARGHEAILARRAPTGDPSHGSAQLAT